MSKWYKGKRIFKGKHKQQIVITAVNVQQNRIDQPSVHSTIPHVKRPSVTGTIPKIFTSRKKDRKGKRRKRSELKRIQSNIQKLEERKEKQQLKSARDTETDRIARILIQGDYAGDPLLDTVLAEYNKSAMSWQEADAKTGKINSHVVETREQYRRLAHMAMKYKSIDELEKAIKSSKGITKTTLKHIHDIALTHPELYNEPALLNVSRETYENETNNGHTEQPNDDNTADSKRLIYDAIVAMINEGLNSSEKYVRFCAGYLMDTLDAEIVQYGDKAYQAIEACEGTWLIEDCRVFIFDSESWQDKLARLESILALIHGNFPSDDEREQIAIWSDALDEFEDY